jgi:uracil-DNA glycosylase
LGIGTPFAGNDATAWGSGKEDEALAAYTHLTGADVSHVSFRVLSPDEAELWLGASPDGLIAPPAAGGHTPGVLEIKCPWNKGRPESATPYPGVPWYYMPQVQGLMAVFDRGWCDVFCYTVGQGSTIYRVERDPEYWALMYRALSDFWWQNVVPGKEVNCIPPPTLAPAGRVMTPPLSTLSISLVCSRLQPRAQSRWTCVSPWRRGSTPSRRVRTSSSTGLRRRTP